MTYLVVVAATAAANLFSAGADFVRLPRIAVGMAKVGVPESWMTMLGVFKAAGAVGVLCGVLVPPLGVAAAVGLIMFFVLAALTHLRVRDYSSSLGLAGVFLLLALASLALRLAA
ncbi:DoxX family protein [Pseudonocardia acaciae]|uniref:DoxX family protein n=1 Tax=Pseudonocardia acaciae TaxID=551276 RepID=UPI000A585F4A|nr:DoxX family protein [Pseudonocardia acaciae]